MPDTNKELQNNYICRREKTLPRHVLIFFLFLFILIFNILFIVDKNQKFLSARVTLVPLYLFSDWVLTDFFFYFKGERRRELTQLRKYKNVLLSKKENHSNFSFLFYITEERMMYMPVFLEVCLFFNLIQI